ncbi:hypothetical protein, partial [Xanthomonas oryzae]|uniref:hypothetical protein n=1 Tax=Xanthomonas oryzae TaxID=347 RepID=UPI001C4A4BFD
MSSGAIAAAAFTPSLRMIAPVKTQGARWPCRTHAVDGSEDSARGPSSLVNRCIERDALRCAANRWRRSTSTDGETSRHRVEANGRQHRHRNPLRNAQYGT